MFGRIMFLLIYLLSGILANLGTFAFANAPVSLGASGAICGLYGAYTYYYLANRKRLGSLTQYGKSYYSSIHLFLTPHIQY